MQFENRYRVLGVPGGRADRIRSVFCKLARKYQPEVKEAL